MLLLVAREPMQDAHHWAGRRSLAVLDAVVWPLAAILLIYLSNIPVGVFGPVLMVAVFQLSVARLHRAISLNHRYRFSTWRWGRVVLLLLMVGAVLKMLT